MATIFWLFARCGMNAPLRDWEILIMIWVDLWYAAAFWAVRKMGKQLDEKNKEDEDASSNKHG